MSPPYDGVLFYKYEFCKNANCLLHCKLKQEEVSDIEKKIKILSHTLMANQPATEARLCRV